MIKLLVGYDGSDQAKEAALVASMLARRLRAEVTVLTVGQMVTPVDAEMILPAVDVVLEKAGRPVLLVGEQASG